MKRTIIALTVILQFATARSLLAQQSVSSYDQAVMDLLKIARGQDSMIAGADAMADTLTKSNPVLVPYRDVIVEWAKKYLTWETLMPEFVKAYKEAFTESEIRELIAFYQTPVGQKMLVKMPELLQK